LDLKDLVQNILKASTISIYTDDNTHRAFGDEPSKTRKKVAQEEGGT